MPDTGINKREHSGARRTGSWGSSLFFPDGICESVGLVWFGHDKIDLGAFEFCLSWGYISGGALALGVNSSAMRAGRMAWMEMWRGGRTQRHEFFKS